MSRYPEPLLDHFRHPRNVGELPPPAVIVEVSNPACGDILRLSARVENGVVREVRYLVQGCTASIAAGSALTEWMAGRTCGALALLQAVELDTALGGLPAESKHAAALCVEAARKLAAAL
jgi:nitrogen fixation NifU-like protein